MRHLRLFLPAGLWLAGCAGPPPVAPPARPTFDIQTIASPELLREANHGRTIEGADGRFVVPPSVRRVWIDVGAHLMEHTRKEMERGDDMALVAIEPLAECWKVWPDNPRLIALPVAISTDRGMMDFNVNVENATSSLLKSVDNRQVRFGLKALGDLTRTVEMRKVPVLRLEDVLERIPAHLDIQWLKTDVQGLDLQVLKSAGEQVRRAGRVRAEVINSRIYEGSGELKPGTESEFVAYMESKGFRFVEDSEVYIDRAWLDKNFVNRQRDGWFSRARGRLTSWAR
jgi:FkbM family methyltransferase